MFLFSERWRPSVGVILCSTAAGGLAYLFRDRSFEGWLPLLFIGVILITAILFGNMAGVVGTLLSCIIFAMFLFQPRRSLIVSNLASRANLIWMVMLGLVLSYFFGSPRPHSKN